MSSPVAIEVDFQSVLLGWSPVNGALAYELQMRTTPICTRVGEKEEQSEDDDSAWKSLSSGIQGTNIRKKNLSEGVAHRFRVRCKLSTGWDDFSPSSEAIQVLSSATLQIAPPIVLARDTASVTLQWSEPTGEAQTSALEGYRLRYRAEEDLQWTHVPTLLKNTQVRKKGLVAGVNFYFSVLPVVEPAVCPPRAAVTPSSEEGTGTGPSTDTSATPSTSVFNADQSASTSARVFAYSPQSLPCQVQQLSPFMTNLFPKQLLSQDGSKLETTDKLAGKVVAVYFSAHWCGPCRQFTPVLSKVYQEVRAGKHAEKFEVVFCSADHSEAEFMSYFKSMAPWLAVDYEDDERESFMGTFKVQGIPKLVILAPDGRILTDSAVSAGFSVAMVEQWLQQCHL